MRLVLRKSEGMEDWYVIERAEHEHRQWMEKTGSNSMSLRDSARFSDADVEGTGAEMLAIAEAIERRGGARFKRCAVDFKDGVFSFCSPRNSTEEGSCSAAEAEELAKEIWETLGKEGR